MQMTPSEVYLAREFALKLAHNNKINSREFGDDRNNRRTVEKIVNDNIKGKLAEMYIANELGYLGADIKMDFEIYPLGVCDDFDVIVGKKAIDVKASSPNARSLMVEMSKMLHWKESKKFPHYLCMVTVDDDYNCEYVGGCTREHFIKYGKKYNRGENLPNTNTKLRTDNWIITKKDCMDIDDLLMFMLKD